MNYICIMKINVISCTESQFSYSEDGSIIIASNYGFDLFNKSKNFKHSPIDFVLYENGDIIASTSNNNNYQLQIEIDTIRWVIQYYNEHRKFPNFDTDINNNIIYILKLDEEISHDAELMQASTDFIKIRKLEKSSQGAGLIVGFMEGAKSTAAFNYHKDSKEMEKYYMEKHKNLFNVVMNLGMQLRQDQLNGRVQSGNDILSEWYNEKMKEYNETV